MGIVRRRKIPDVVINPDTKRPTEESLNAVLESISKQSGHGTRIEGVYIQDDHFQEMIDYATAREAQNTDPDREPYSTNLSNCGHFMQSCVEAGGIDTRWYIDPRPNSYID